jgi:PIN domain nuclease of toxin-antitoxin system
VRLLLDTHFAFWWQTGDPRVTEAVRNMVETADEVFVSSVSLWELTIKAGLGKVRIDLPVFAEQVESMGFSWLPIRNAHILKLPALPAYDDHRDPFDRLLIAQSMSEPLILLTADGKLGRYGSTVRVI